VAAEPGNSGFNLWLGGRTAAGGDLQPSYRPGYAPRHGSTLRKQRIEPEQPGSAERPVRYYLDAPGFLGGGFREGGSHGEQIARINPAEGHWAQAKLAEKRKSSRAPKNNCGGPLS